MQIWLTTSILNNNNTMNQYIQSIILWKYLALRISDCLTQKIFYVQWPCRDNTPPPLLSCLPDHVSARTKDKFLHIKMHLLVL